MSVRESETNLDFKVSVCKDLKFDPCQMMLPCSSHAQPMHSLSKMDEFELFGKVRSGGTTFMLNTFPFEACIMMNFEVEVWKFQHVEIFLSVKPYLSIFPIA